MRGAGEVAVADAAEPGADLDPVAGSAAGVGERSVGGPARVGMDGRRGQRDDLHVHEPTNGPRRILVAGTSGSGKSTVAADVAVRTGLPYVELDALRHGPGWVVRPEFVADGTALAARDAWITEWQYSALRPLLLDRRSCGPDLPRWRVFAQLVSRTVRRRLRRTVLGNGNVEPPLWSVFTDPEHLLRWAWRSHPRTALRIARAQADGRCPPVVRLRSRSAVRAWLAGLKPSGGGRSAPVPPGGSPTPSG